MNYQHNPPLAQACSLFLIQNSLYIPHTALLRTAPSLLERGNGGEDSAGASLQLVPNSKFSLHPHTALLRTAPSLLERGNGGEDSTVYFKSLRKAKILKKLLIEKYFISLHSKKQNKLSYVLV